MHLHQLAAVRQAEHPFWPVIRIQLLWSIYKLNNNSIRFQECQIIKMECTAFIKAFIISTHSIRWKVCPQFCDSIKLQRDWLAKNMWGHRAFLVSTTSKPKKIGQSIKLAEISQELKTLFEISWPKMAPSEWEDLN